jgi:hypothetical protein
VDTVRALVIGSLIRLTDLYDLLAEVLALQQSQKCFWTV